MLPDLAYPAHTTRLTPGESLVVVSDGYLDFFPVVEEALQVAADVVAACSSAEEVVARFADYAGDRSLADDATVVVLHRVGR